MFLHICCSHDGITLLYEIESSRPILYVPKHVVCAFGHIYYRDLHCCGQYNLHDNSSYVGRVDRWQNLARATQR